MLFFLKLKMNLKMPLQIFNFYTNNPINFKKKRIFTVNFEVYTLNAKLLSFSII